MSLVVPWVGFTVCSLLLCAMGADGGGFLPTTSVAKIRVNSLKHCPEYPGLTTHFDDFVFFPGPESSELMYTDGMLTIGKEIPEDIMLRVDYKKCFTKDDASCEKYLVTHLRDVCKHIADETKSWSQFVKQVREFSPICPLQPGTYSIEEAPVDLSPFENMTDFVGHWQLSMSFVSKMEVIGCILADVDVYLKKQNSKS